MNGHNQIKSMLAFLGVEVMYGAMAVMGDSFWEIVGLIGILIGFVGLISILFTTPKEEEEEDKEDERSV